MGIDTPYDPYCAAWLADDSILPNPIDSLPYQCFFIIIQTEFVYPVDVDDHDNQEESFDEDSLQYVTRASQFMIPSEQLMNPTTCWSSISYMLTSVGIQLQTQPFMIHKISDCVNEFATKDSVRNRSVVPIMVSISVVVGEEEDFSETESMEEDDDDTSPRTMPASESALEVLKKLSVEDQRLMKEQNCMVCLDDIEVGCEAKQMPCSHVYHSDCILNWLRVSNFCPLCRHNLPK